VTRAFRRDFEGKLIELPGRVKWFQEEVRGGEGKVLNIEKKHVSKPWKEHRTNDEREEKIELWFAALER